MQLKLFKIKQAIQILQKLKLFKKLQIIILKIYKILQNIMIVDIDKKISNFKLMNLLQLKWILYILTLKKNYKKLFK